MRLRGGGLERLSFLARKETAVLDEVQLRLTAVQNELLFKRDRIRRMDELETAQTQIRTLMESLKRENSTVALQTPSAFDHERRSGWWW